MANLMPFDEINALESLVVAVVNDPAMPVEDKRKLLEDEIEDVLILAYLHGTEYANSVTGSSIQPDDGNMDRIINIRFDDMDFRDRIAEYVPVGDSESIIRCIRTDSTRTYNESVLDAGKRSGKRLNKVWETMLDNKVRDTHSYLEGVMVPIDEEFYTYDGDSAMYPGGFSNASNNCGCRCTLDIVAS